MAGAVRVVVVTLVMGIAGCGRGDCSAKPAGDERDWCYHGQAISLAGEKRTEEALQTLEHIEAPLVRAMATEKILTDSPAGITQQQAEALCRALPEPHGSSCLRAWSRPHLWNKP